MPSGFSGRAVDYSGSGAKKVRLVETGVAEVQNPSAFSLLRAAFFCPVSFAHMAKLRLENDTREAMTE